MKMCIECNGSGQKQDLSFVLDIYGNSPAHTSGAVCPATSKTACGGCAGTGKYQSFGAYEGQ